MENIDILSSVTGSIDASIWAVDCNYRLLYSNRAFNNEYFTAFGKMPEPGGSLLSATIPEEYKRSWRSWYDRAFNGEKFIVELERRFPGKSAWNKYVFSPLSGGDGEIYGATIISLDITERKRAETAFHKSESRYKNLYESAAVPIWEEDFSEIKKYFDKLKGDGVTDFREYFETHPDSVRRCAEMIKILDVNETSLEFFGVISKDELFKKLPDFFIDESYETFREELITLAEGGRLCRTESVFMNLRGELRHLSLYLSVSPEAYHDLSNVLVSFIDITDRKNIELKYSALFSEMMDGCAIHEIICDEYNNPVDYVTIEANKSFQKILGVELEGVLGKKASEILPPEEHKAWLAKFGNIAMNGGSMAYEQYSPLQKKYFEGTVYSTQKGFVAVTFRDATQRKLIEEALKDRENRYEEAQRIGKMGSWVNMMEPYKISWSEETYRIFGYRRGEEEPADIFKTCIHPEDGDIFFKKIRRLYNDEAIGNMKLEFRIIDKNGGLKYLDTSMEFICDSEGKKIGAQGVLQDITERRLSEEKLKESEERYRSLIEMAPVGIAISRNGDIIFCNKEMLNILGAGVKSDIENKKIIDFIHPDDIHIIEEKIRETQKGTLNYPYSIKHRIIRCDGSARLIAADVAITYIDSLRHSIGFFRDITKENELESQKKRLISDSMFFNMKNQMVNELQANCINMSKKYGFSNSDKKVSEKIFKKYSDTEKDWAIFKTHFNELYKDFLITLQKKYPQLTQTDLRHCSYIKMNYSTKEIARLFGVQDTSVQKSRVRLKKKFKLNQNDDLIKFIQNI